MLTILLYKYCLAVAPSRAMTSFSLRGMESTRTFVSQANRVLRVGLGISQNSSEGALTHAQLLPYLFEGHLFPPHLNSCPLFLSFEWEPSLLMFPKTVRQPRPSTATCMTRQTKSFCLAPEKFCLLQPETH